MISADVPAAYETRMRCKLQLVYRAEIAKNQFFFHVEGSLGSIEKNGEGCEGCDGGYCCEVVAMANPPVNVPAAGIVACFASSAFAAIAARMLSTASL